MKKQAIVKTKYGDHLIVLERDGKNYMVTVPGLREIITQGENIAHAKDMAKEAIELTIECLVEENIKNNKKISFKKLAKQFATINA
ncbi:MAG: type II toxin-antitoxin system HicB family antitoxin [bacterium]|nr:type II toxin-antitoxin system HicB family antitoxin [bacterium]